MKATLFFSLLLTVVTTFSHPTEDFNQHIEEEWIKFKQIYGRKFADENMELSRKIIFEKNLKMIRHHNMLYSMGLKSHGVGINQFADMTLEEIHYMNGGYEVFVDLQQQITSNISNSNLPKEVDWRTKGLVTPVKNQGTCGSCWSFSVTGAIEAHHAKATGKLVSLSEQNLIDCSSNKKYDNSGCHGGIRASAFQFVIDNKGIDTEESYPYEGVDYKDCRYKVENVGATISDFYELEAGNEFKLMEAVATVGPVAAGLDAHHDTFHFYNGDGIYDEPNCSSETLTHAILVVGYGSENGRDYWLIKNSWGMGWGDNGYLKLARNEGNKCGIATRANYPIV